MAISKNSWTGVAREATSGTAITTPTLYVPTKTTFKAKKKRVYLNEERGDRNENYGVVDSVRQCDIDLKGPYYNDAHVYFLLGAMGVDTVTTPFSGVYSHALSLGNIPPSLTITRGLDAACYQSPYAVVEKFELKYSADGKLLEFDTNLIGIWPTVVGSPPTPSYSTLLPFAGYLPTITLGGTASTDVNEMNIKYAQKISLWYPCNGSQDYITAYFGERMLEFDYIARFDNTTNYNKFRAATNESLNVVLTGPIIASTYAQSLTINIPTVTYDEMDHDMGKDNILLKVKGKALAQTTQFFSITAQNSVAAYSV
jgi:tail tube protein